MKSPVPGEMALSKVSLPMRGEWIEIYDSLKRNTYVQGLSPCGESGLKCQLTADVLIHRVSLPMRGEWIEIRWYYKTGVNIMSLPMRGEWIEILTPDANHIPMRVSPHAGRVD